MNTVEALRALADRNGIEPFYYDFGGQKIHTNPDTHRAILCSLGLKLDNDAMVQEALAESTMQDDQREFPVEFIVESRTNAWLPFGEGTTWQVVSVEHNTLAAEGIARQQIKLPPLDSGIYDLVVARSERVENITLLVTPAHSPSVSEIASTERLWGMNAALYGLRSGRNDGVGDFEDLARLGEILASKGAAFLGINPVHAIGTMADDVISPYSPSHRAMLNTTHIALDCLPGFRDTHRTTDCLSQENTAAAGETDPRLIDYAAHREMHKNTLETAFRNGAAAHKSIDLERLDTASSDADATEFALFESISESNGADWRYWPQALQQREAKTLQAFGQEHRDRIEFHLWLQRVAESQLESAHLRSKSAGMPLGLYLDLAVGSRRGGAESWCNQEVLAGDVAIGAPPDYFNPEGQNWQLSAMAPQKLKSSKYAAFRSVLRATMRHAGIMRIDHVLGLNRSFWIPDNGAPGCYINQSCDALAAIVKIEAERAGTVIIGEDLGLVPDGFRDKMRANGFYGYSVLQFEKEHNGDHRNPAYYDRQVLACFGTHDTATMRGFAEGNDIDWSVKLGWIDNNNAEKAHQLRSQDVNTLKVNLTGNTDCDLEDALHSALAYSPAELLSVQLDDVLRLVDSQNLPGTISEHPNWRMQYPTLIDDLSSHQNLCDTADIMQQGGRSTLTKG